MLIRGFKAPKNCAWLLLSHPWRLNVNPAVYQWLFLMPAKDECQPYWKKGRKTTSKGRKFPISFASRFFDPFSGKLPPPNFHHLCHLPSGWQMVWFHQTIYIYTWIFPTMLLLKTSNTTFVCSFWGRADINGLRHPIFFWSSDHTSGFLFFSFFLAEKTAAGCPCQGGKGIPIVGIPGDKSRHENQRVGGEMGSFCWNLKENY